MVSRGSNAMIVDGTRVATLAGLAKTLTVEHNLDDIITTRQMDHAIEVIDAEVDNAIMQATPHDGDPQSWIRCLNLMEQMIHDSLEEARRYWRHEENFWW